MKKTIFIVLLFIIQSTIINNQLKAQSPQSFKYQAVARNSAGDILTNQSISIRISIHETSPGGPIVYEEEHVSILTNEFGLVNLEIGNGFTISGDFTTINWGSNDHFIEIEMDETGGTSYTFMGTAQLLSVPYSLYSEKTGNIDDADADPANELQVLTISNDTIYLSNGGFVKLPADLVDDADADPTNELQVLSFSNDTIFLSNGGFVILPADQTADADADPTNEIQLLSFSNDTLWLSNGGYVVFPYKPIPLTSDDSLFECGNEFTDIRDGKKYKTVLIGTQCWMAENLHIGTVIPPSANAANNGIIEKYCHGGINSDATSGDCINKGGLYQWDEMMQYTIIEGTQGVCPAGWHIPTDAEWCILENFVDATTDPGCSLTGWRGTDGGTKLKTGGSSGFEALLAGSQAPDGLFYDSGAYTDFWSSGESGSNAWTRDLYPTEARVGRNPDVKLGGFSVRCLKD